LPFDEGLLHFFEAHRPNLSQWSIFASLAITLGSQTSTSLLRQIGLSERSRILALISLNLIIHVLAGLALALILSVAGCQTQEPPKVIDTESKPKAPAAPDAAQAKVKAP
jgi:hypothetical protein